MQPISINNTVFVFDLDDTLYSEREYERSGISFVYEFLKDNSVGLSEDLGLEALLVDRTGWVDVLIESFEIPGTISAHEILNLYRGHLPNIRLYPDAQNLLNSLRKKNAKMSIITDGRSVTQRQKLKALSIDNYIDDFYISEEVGYEKPHPFSFNSIAIKYQGANFIYFGDNPRKDFLTPNKLGWSTICLLDRGRNIHKQNFYTNSEYLPKHSIRTFDDLILVNE